MRATKENQKIIIDSIINRTGAKLETFENLQILTYWAGKNQTRPAAYIFKGIACNPIINHYFPNKDHRARTIESYKKRATDTRKAKEATKQAKKAINNDHITIGDIYYSSWGYDQTNINFYKVVGKFGKKGVKFIAIGSDIKNTGNMSGYSEPYAKLEIGKPFKKIMHAKDYFTLDDVCSISKWDGRPKYVSWYA